MTALLTWWQNASISAFAPARSPSAIWSRAGWATSSCRSMLRLRIWKNMASRKTCRVAQAPLYRLSPSQQWQAVAVDADGGWCDGLSGDAGGGELQHHGVGSRRSAGRGRYRPTGCVLCARTGRSRQAGADSAALEQRVRRHVHVLSATHADAATCAALYRFHHRGTAGHAYLTIGSEVGSDVDAD